MRKGNTGSQKWLFYHFDNIGSTTCVTDIAGAIVEAFTYGTYGELLSTVQNGIRFLYNGAYGVVTDSNGLYYMRARYYNPDIKRFINQDIKVGDIGNSQSLNRYAYCEGNPVSLINPFGLSPETSQDQGKESKFKWLHNLLDGAGFFFDVADVVNAAIYAMEGDWGNAMLCAVAVIPIVGSAIKGAAKATKAVVKAKKAMKVAELAAEASKLTKNAGNMLDTLNDTVKATTKWGDNPFKLVDNVTADAGIKTMKALETGGDFGQEARKAARSMESVTSPGGLRLSTSADESASLLKGSVTRTDGIAKSVKSGKSTELAIYDPEFAARQLLDGGTTSEEVLRTIIPKDVPNTFVPSDTIKDGYKYNFSINGKKMEIKWHSADLNAAVKYPGSNSGSGWTAQIKVGNKLMTQAGRFIKKAKNYTHIPLRGGGLND